MFVDVASRRIFSWHQVSLNAHETMESKQMSKQDVMTAGVKVQAYNTDNGV
jgi:hypothetical protein